MANYLVFNNDANNLKTTVYGVDGEEFKPIAVDSSGRFLFSPLSSITVTATDLGIRNLNASQDSVTVTAIDLDIRNLNGNQDSVQISGNGFVEDTLTTSVATGTSYLLTKNISQYKENSYFIRNTGASNIAVTLQLAPADTTAYYVDNSTSQNVTPSNNFIMSATATMKFARLKVVASGNTSVIIYYNGRA